MIERPPSNFQLEGGRGTERKIVSGIVLTLFLIGTLTSTFNIIPVLAEPQEEWVPYVPHPDQVGLVFWTANQSAYVNATITFGDPCINITDWGTVFKADHDIWVDSEIWDWTGVCILIIWTESHTYDLGHLEEGNYTFTFMAWNIRVKSINFTIVRADANYDPPVGGIHIPVNKLELLAPYIGLTILLAVAVTTVVYVKKRKKNTEINS